MGNYEAHEWQVGESITRNGMNRIENGLEEAYLNINALMEELGGTKDGIHITNSRLDLLQTAITGSEDGIYSAQSSIAARLSSCEDLEAAHTTRLDAIEAINTAQSTNIAALQTKASALATELFGSDTVEGTSVLDSVINEMWGGTAGTGTNFAASSRIDDIITAIAGSSTLDTTTNIYGRLTAIENEIGAPDSGINARISTLEELVGDPEQPDSDSLFGQIIEVYEIRKVITGSYSGTYSEPSIYSRLSSLASNINNLETVIGDASDPAANSILGQLANHDNRITYLEEHGSGGGGGSSIVQDALVAEIGGTRDGATGFTNSRIDSLETNVSNLQSGLNKKIILTYARITQGENGDVFTLDDEIEDKCIGLIIFDQQSAGLNALKFILPNSATQYPVYHTGLNDPFTQTVPQYHILGVYRNQNSFIIFNAPTIF